MRRLPANRSQRGTYRPLSDFSEIRAEHAALEYVQVVIRLASRVYLMDETELDPLVAFRAVNVGDWLKLARSAANAGAERFIFVSSVKFNGEGIVPGQPIVRPIRLNLLTVMASLKSRRRKGLVRFRLKRGFRSLSFGRCLSMG